MASLAASANQPDFRPDWPSIRAAAVALRSVRDAAMRAAAHLLPAEQTRFVERVNKRAYRERWLDQANALSKLDTRAALPLSKPVQTGADIAANAIAESKTASLTALSSVTAKIARKWDKADESELPEPEKVNQLASAHAKLHPSEKAEVNVSLNIAAFFG